MDVVTNYFAVIVGAVLSMIIGYLWYGPIFGSTWLRETGVTPEMAESRRKDMSSKYALMFVGSLLTSFVFYKMVTYVSGFMQSSTTNVGIITAFWIWIGFVVPIMLSKVLWDRKSWTIWAIDSFYYLVSLLVLGVLFINWA